MTAQTWVKTKTLAGDTVSTLTARYGVTKAELLRANNVLPKEDHSPRYIAQRAKELALPPRTPLSTASKVIEESDISVWVSDSEGRAVELQPGSLADINRFAKCPPGQYAVFAAGNVIYLPEWTVRDATLPLENIKPVSPQAAPLGRIGGPMTGIARSLARLPQARGKYIGSYTIGSVDANAKIYDTTKSGDVMEIQEELNDVWGASPKLAVDGIYGPLTTAQVKKFQSANLLPANGVVDRATSLKLQDDEAHEVSFVPGTTPAKQAQSQGNSMWGLLGLLGLAGVAVGGVALYKNRTRRNPRRKRPTGRRKSRKSRYWLYGKRVTEAQWRAHGGG